MKRRNFIAGSLSLGVAGIVGNPASALGQSDIDYNNRIDILYSQSELLAALFVFDPISDIGNLEKRNARKDIRAWDIITSAPPNRSGLPGDNDGEVSYINNNTGIPMYYKKPIGVVERQAVEMAFKLGTFSKKNVKTSGKIYAPSSHPFRELKITPEAKAALNGRDLVIEGRPEHIGILSLTYMPNYPERYGMMMMKDPRPARFYFHG